MSLAAIVLCEGAAAKDLPDQITDTEIAAVRTAAVLSESDTACRKSLEPIDVATDAYFIDMAALNGYDVRSYVDLTPRQAFVAIEIYNDIKRQTVSRIGARGEKQFCASVYSEFGPSGTSAPGLVRAK